MMQVQVCVPPVIARTDSIVALFAEYAPEEHVPEVQKTEMI